MASKRDRATCHLRPVPASCREFLSDRHLTPPSCRGASWDIPRGRSPQERWLRGITDADTCNYLYLEELS